MFKDLARGIQANRRFTHVESHMGRVYADVMEKRILTPNGRGPEYRPSSFPICPVQVHMQFIQAAELGYYQSNMHAGGGYFTTVGTAAHENIQYYMGETGKVYGHWKCRNPKCQKHHDARDLYDEKGKLIRPGKNTRENTTKNTCPKCKVACEYVEICINYNGLKGHVDCIYEMPDGTYWVLDYKTSTKGAIKMSPSKLPKREHLMQVPTYCYVLEKKNGLKISGFSLLYLSRDNPFEFREIARDWNKRWRAEIKELIIDQKKKYRAAVNSFIQNKPEISMKCKPCQRKGDYEKMMPAYEPCPMEEVCFSKRDLKDNMLHALKPEKLLHLVDITNNMANYIEDEHMPVVKKAKRIEKPKSKVKKKSTKILRLTKQ